MTKSLSPSSETAVVFYELVSYGDSSPNLESAIGKHLARKVRDNEMFECHRGLSLFKINFNAFRSGKQNILFIMWTGNYGCG